MGLSDNQQAATLVTGAALAVGGVYYAVKIDASVGAGLITAGLAILGIKEAVGSQNNADQTDASTVTK